MSVPGRLVGGSSPPMRGAHFQHASVADNHRIIPADAGSTRCSWTTRARAGDHPRGCGEHSEARKDKERERGSSPRMRGAQSMSWCVHW